jgi:hypothetical protein
MLSLFLSLKVSSLKIRNTSDVYVHQVVASKHKHFTITPPIAHDLSLSVGEFKSEINPKQSHVNYLCSMIEAFPEKQKSLIKEIEIEKKKIYEHQQRLRK